MFIRNFIKKQVSLSLVTVLMLAILIFGSSYALFQRAVSDTNVQSLNVGDLTIAFSNSSNNTLSDNDAIDLEDLTPMTDAAALLLNNNLYSFVITNTGTISYCYTIKLQNNPNYTTNLLSHQYVRYKLNTNEPQALSQATNGIIQRYTINPNETDTYQLRLWVADAETYQLPNETIGQEVHLNIVIEGEACEERQSSPDHWDEPGNNTLLAGIKSNNKRATSTISIPGQEKSASGSIDSKFMSADWIDDYVGQVPYASTVSDLRNNTNVSTGSFYTDYANMVGKYFIIEDFDYGYQDFQVDNGSIYYIYSADSSGATVIGPINSAVHLGTEAVLASTEDDYGTSFYYRGSVENNYVSFAGMCWRIVRVDGAGNIKLALSNYNPNSAANPCAASLDGDLMAFARLTANDASSYTSPFNQEYAYNTNVGYMYSNSPTSTVYATHHANENDSDILTFLKGWYDRVFSAADKEKLADVIWCNDKRLVTDNTYNPFDIPNAYITNYGTSTYDNYYLPTSRISFSSTAAPSLKCGTNKTDNLISKFTASSQTDDGYGNGLLNGYKIGLLTVDELAFAGANDESVNTAFYLAKNATAPADTYWYYWLLSPATHEDASGNWGVTPSGRLAKDWVSSNNPVRPAISLKYDTTISGGKGTQANPFVIN